MSITGRIFGLPTPGRTPGTFAIDPATHAAARKAVRGGHCACLSLRTKKGTPAVPGLHLELQDTAMPEWQNLLALIATHRNTAAAIFEPLSQMPAEQWSHILTLPDAIETLSTLKTLRLYGSHLRRLPPEIGRLSAREGLDIYTSYSLHWLPYEVTRCTRLRETRMSTRALYGNIKTRLPFPRLSGPQEALRPPTYSICDQPFEERPVRAFWTTQRIATDTVPLLLHSCSAECLARVPDAPDGYHARPHRGGGGVGMPNPDRD